MSESVQHAGSARHSTLKGFKSGPPAIFTTNITLMHGSELNKIHPARIMLISLVFVVAMLTLFLKAGAPSCCLLVRHLVLHSAYQRKCKQNSQHTAA